MTRARTRTARARPCRARAALVACAVIASAGLVGGCGSAASEHGSATSSAQSEKTGTSPDGSSGGASIKVTRRPRYAAPPASAPVLHGNVRIAYRNIAIYPDAVKVRAGSTVSWTNYDPQQHNVTSAPGAAQRFASHDFGEGRTFTVKLDRPGVIHYMCTLHPASMNGTILVVR